MDNPCNIAALVLVDTSPRWLYGHTVVTPAEHRDEQSLALALVAERIGVLALHVEEMGLPIITVESTCLEYYAVHTLGNKRVALCGVYGGSCVDVVARWLEGQGIEPLLVRDVIVWPPDEEPRGTTSAELFPGCFFPDWLLVPQDLTYGE